MPKDTARRQKAGPGNREMEGGKYFSKVVGKALNLLELIGKSTEPLGLNELTRRAELPKSSVFRILYTLEVAGYIAKDESGNYRLAADATPWSEGSLVKELVDVAIPLMSELRRRFKETVSMSFLFNNHIETVAVLESPHLVRMANTVGRIIPPHASSMGKAITAFQPEQRREMLIRSYGLNRFTANTITDENELNREFERIRDRGWSIDAGESTDEGCCFGVPVSIRNEVRAAISVSLPRPRVPDGDARTEMIEAIRETATEIGKRIAERL